MDIDTDEEFEDEVLDKRIKVMNHILLPRKLPQEQYDSCDTDLALMNQIVEIVQKLDSHLPAKTVKLLKKVRQIYLKCTPTAVSKAIKTLGPGDTFAMFLRSQDCAIMFHVPKDEIIDNVQNVIIATTPRSLDPSAIYDNAGSGIEVICIYLKISA